MNNRTVLYYLLAGPVYYQLIKDRSKLHRLKKEVLKEIEYFFGKRYIRRESWHRRYFKILISVFSVSLLARRIERRMFRSQCAYGDKYSKFAPATMLALKEYNSNRSYFYIDTDDFIILRDLIYEINKKVNSFCGSTRCIYQPEYMIHANTPLGIELEFTNKGATAGRFFENNIKDALHNFSKYHYYHLMKFMWRFGAYVDAEMPFKQFIRKGGFLEYTFTRPDIAFKPSQPLTSSPRLAARLIEEAIKFTPVHPHSLHVTFQTGQEFYKLPQINYGQILALFMCTGHFEMTDKVPIETRLTEGNMKDWAVIRDRRNDCGWVKTIEYTHMRACRDFVKRGVYESAILMLLAYKNLYNLENIGQYTRKLNEWAKKPSVPNINLEKLSADIKKGLDIEVSLPEYYKNDAVGRICALFEYNAKLIKN